MAKSITREEAVQEWMEVVMDDYSEPWRQTVADDVAERIIGSLPEAERTDTLIRSVTETALTALGLKPLPEAQEGES